MRKSRWLLVLFSVFLHSTVAGALTIFSGNGLGDEERVYHVALAEFAVPQAAVAPAPPEPPAEAPPAPPEPEPEPEPEPPKQEEAKVISSKKDQKKTPPKKAEAKPKPAVPQSSQAASGPPGPRTSQIGGYAAYRSNQVDQRPSISRRVAPIYPEKAKRMNIQGRVVVQLVVDTTGSPKACTVKQANPPGYFEDAALQAAAKTHFIPGKLKGRVVNTMVLMPFDFKLR